MLFENYITDNKDEFLTKEQSLCQSLNIDPNWLMSVMWLESRLDPAAVNPDGGATGLIQFYPSTAIDLGTTVDSLVNMSNVQQLPWVYKYLKIYASKVKTFFDLYLAIFFPLGIGKPDNWVIHSTSLTAEQVARVNKTFDLNGDFQITIAEFKTAVSRLLPAEAAKYILKQKSTWGIIALSGFVIYLIFKK